MDKVKSIKEILTSEDTFTTILLTILMDKYGTDFMSWDPLTCTLQVQDDFQIELPLINQDKIQAGCTLFTTNLFHVSLESFSTICNTLSFVPMTPGTLLPPSIDECLWGCTEARLLEGPDYDQEGFSHNIASYVGQLLNEEGIYKPPSVLAFTEYPADVQTNANNFLDDPTEFQSFWQRQRETQDKLEELTKIKLQELLQQLKELPLKDIRQDFVVGLLKSLEEDLSQSIL